MRQAFNFAVNILGLAFLVGATSFGESAEAFTLSNGQTLMCTVQTNGGPVTVPEYTGFANGFAGFTQQGPNGLPFITFDPSRMPSPGILVDFLFYHECAHARFPIGFVSQAHAELNANCEGLRKMRSDGNISTSEETQVGNFHAITNQYANFFGTGKNFWNLTLQCAMQPSQMAEMVYGGSQPNSLMGSFCCTFAGPKLGPFPPPHLPVGAACVAPIGVSMVPGIACN